MLQPAYPLETTRLRLRPYALDDLDAFYAIESLLEVMKYLYGEPCSREEARVRLERQSRRWRIAQEGDQLVLAMELRGSPAHDPSAAAAAGPGGTVIGSVNLRWLSAEHRQGEIGFILHPDYQGQGYAREAAVAMLRLGFQEMHLHRIIGRCDVRNLASARLMERLGMRREAHFRENEWFKGAWGDEYVYALLAAEWESQAQR
jgi:RimJ/RimL family protein N-acetyltransferase